MLSRLRVRMARLASSSCVHRGNTCVDSDALSVACICASLEKGDAFRSTCQYRSRWDTLHLFNMKWRPFTWLPFAVTTSISLPLLFVFIYPTVSQYTGRYVMYKYLQQTQGDLENSRWKAWERFIRLASFASTRLQSCISALWVFGPSLVQMKLAKEPTRKLSQLLLRRVRWYICSH